MDNAEMQENKQSVFNIFLRLLQDCCSINITPNVVKKIFKLVKEKNNYFSQQHYQLSLQHYSILFSLSIFIIASFSLFFILHYCLSHFLILYYHHKIILSIIHSLFLPEYHSVLAKHLRTENE